jgi:hypothetical protein
MQKGGAVTPPFLLLGAFSSGLSHALSPLIPRLSNEGGLRVGRVKDTSW